MAIMYSGDEEFGDDVTSGCDKPDYDVFEEREVFDDHEGREDSGDE